MTRRGCNLQVEKHCFTGNGFSHSGLFCHCGSMSMWQFLQTASLTLSHAFYDVIILYWARRILWQYLYILQLSRNGLLFLLLCLWVFDLPVCLLIMYIQNQWKPEQEVGSSTLWNWSYRRLTSSMWVLEIELHVLWKSHQCSSLQSPLSGPSSTCFKYLTSMVKFARKYPCKVALPTRP